MTTHKQSRPLIASLDDDIRDRLFRLVDGPAVVEELTGRRPHATALHRWARKGISGVCLQTVTVGRRRYSTRRWLLDWFAAVDQTLRAKEGSRK